MSWRSSTSPARRSNPRRSTFSYASTTRASLNSEIRLLDTYTRRPPTLATTPVTNGYSPPRNRTITSSNRPTVSPARDTNGRLINTDRCITAPAPPPGRAGCTKGGVVIATPLPSKATRQV